ncbi:ABC transporter ATP-binding protein [Clostridium sp. ATCC 25772]|uniref:ATP-binding cassette domain-containing protein n=1 Tax=Clostridium sp. ATCC 25772 TaxID=1676991 RepID=UPI0007861FCE|nr:ABC transporter ATP-binding protein [Clostridium sp. ATCC 25772]
MKSKFNGILPISKTIIYIFFSNLKANPIILILSMCFSLIQGLSYGMIAKRLKIFFDSVSINININKGDILSDTINALIILIGIIAFAMFINGLNNAFHNLVEGRIKETALLNLHNKSKKLTPFSFEDTNILDSLQKAREGADASTNLLFVIILIFTFYIPSLAYLTIFFLNIHPLLALTLPIIFIPTIINQMFRIKIFSELADKSGPKLRELKSLEDSIVGKDYYKETRLLGVFPYLYRKYSLCLNQVLNLKWRSEKKVAIKEGVLRLISLIAYILVILLLTYLLINNNISQGSFAAVLSTVGFMFSTLEELIFYHIETISNNIGYVNNYVKYMTLTEDNYKSYAPINMKSKISLDNISFSYPNQNKMTLNNIKFNIKKGETLAIVGMNGAGKSTFAKLILGFYKPEKGEVKYDSISIKDKSLDDICYNTSGVMQNFNRYKFSLEDNIAIADMSKDIDRKKIMDSLETCEVKVNEFDKGLETILSTEFSGIDLSGGQWQRLAMCRALYKNNNVLVLDEPTAAIDPEMETSIYKSIKKISFNKTSIIITHRLGITAYVDRIVVLNDGKIIEEGSHSELMAFESNYKKMYLAQRKWYDFDY